MRRGTAAALVVAVASLSCPAGAAGADDPPAAAAAPAKAHGWKQLRFDVGYVARRPFRLERRGRIKLGAILGGAALLYLAREEIREHVRDHGSDDLGDWADAARDVFGKGAFAPALAAALYGASFATGNDRERETAQLLLESMALSGAGALGGSFVLAAERPEQGDSVHLFDTDGRGVSLDAALAASVIPPLRRRYLRVRPEDGRWRRVWKRSSSALLYGGALLTAYQRLDADKHWAPDVYLGLATGLGVGKALCDAHEQPRAPAVAWKAALAPDGLGLTIRFRPGRGVRGMRPAALDTLTGPP